MNNNRIVFKIYLYFDIIRLNWRYIYSSSSSSHAYFVVFILVLVLVFDPLLAVFSCCVLEVLLIRLILLEELLALLLVPLSFVRRPTKITS